MSTMTAFLVALALAVAIVAVVVLVGLPLVNAVQERLRIDLERRLAEARIQRVTTEALLRMLREQRRL